MRDIRGDLQERANLVDEQIRAAVAHFDKAIQQLQTERDARIADHAARDSGLPFSCTRRALFEEAQ